MPNALRNTWIICKHECFKRIRTRSFLITTFLMPGFLTLIVGIPAVLGPTPIAPVKASWWCARAPILPRLSATACSTTPTPYTA